MRLGVTMSLPSKSMCFALNILTAQSSFVRECMQRYIETQEPFGLLIMVLSE